MKMACSDCGSPMRKMPGSLPEGEARCHPCRRIAAGLTVRKRDVPHGDLYCADCGKQMWKGKTSRPQGLARCLPCRRANSGTAKPKSRPNRKPRSRRTSKRAPTLCEGGCGTPLGLDPADRRWKYCSKECRETVRKQSGLRWGTPTRSTVERGYGYAHQKLRRSLLPAAYGQPCPICGVTMELGDLLHLDHSEDRASYRGMVHGACNIRDGAQRGGAVGNRNRRAA